MKLFIDTAQKDKIIIGIDDERFESEAKQDRSQKLLPFLMDILQKKSINFCDISEIEVNTGPGSFTGLRVGVTVAETLGWSLGVPVNGRRMDKNESVKINYD